MGRGGVGPVAGHRGHAHALLAVGVLVGGDILEAAAAALRYGCPVLIGYLKYKTYQYSKICMTGHLRI